MSGKTTALGVSLVVAKGGRVTVSLKTAGENAVLQFDEAGAEELALLLVSALRETKRRDFDPRKGVAHQFATGARITAETKVGPLGLSERLVLVVQGQGATKFTMHLDAAMADKIVADAEARAIRNRSKTKN